MSLISNPHLVHLIRKLIPKDEQDAMLSAMNLGPAGVQAVLARLDEESPGIAAHLNAIYRDHGKRTIHLWRSPRIEELTEERARAALSEVTGAGVGAEWVRIPAPSTPIRDRLARFRVANGSISCTVRVTAPRKVPIDTVDEVKVVQSYQPVDLSVEIGTNYIEVYASLNHARRAAQAVLRSLFPDAPDTGSRGWKKWLRPVSFTEDGLEGFAAVRNLSFVAVRGPDPEGSFGAVAYDARRDGGTGLEIPLDPSEARIAAQLELENEYRVFTYTFTHDDGFVETARAKFYFGESSPSHITFESRTSRLAQRWLIREIVDEF